MYKSILVPLDGSKFAECALQHVKEIALGCHVANVILLTVIEQPQETTPEGSSKSQIEEMARERERMRKIGMANAADYLSKVAEILNKEKVDTKTAVVPAEGAHGVADEILDYAKNNTVDLIIMSTHGRSGISRWAMGSVADKVVRGSISPVLTVAPAGCRI